jgi:hypothetical protein
MVELAFLSQSSSSSLLFTSPRIGQRLCQSTPAAYLAAQPSNGLLDMAKVLIWLGEELSG